MTTTLTTTLTAVFPDAPPVARAVHDTLVAAGFVYSAPSPERSRAVSWPTGFMLDYSDATPYVVYVSHWDDSFMPWYQTTADERAAYQEALARYQAVLIQASIGLLVATHRNGAGRDDLSVCLASAERGFV